MSACFGKDHESKKVRRKHNRHSLNDQSKSPPRPQLQRSYSEASLDALRGPINSSLSQEDPDKIQIVHPSSSLFGRRVLVKNVLILYNPSSGSHKGERIMQMAKRELEKNTIAVQVLPLQYPSFTISPSYHSTFTTPSSLTDSMYKNHAMDICKTYDFSAFDVLCVVGGDGTFHECINGLMSRESPTIQPPPASDSFPGNHSLSMREKLPVLAIIPAGTGNSLVLELAGVSNIKHSIGRILQGVTIPIDVSFSLFFWILKVTILHVRQEPTNAQGERASSSNPDSSSQLASFDSNPPATATEPDSSVEQLLEFSRDQQVSKQVRAGYLEKEVMYAFNSIHWGLGSKVSETAERLRWMRHALRYTSAALMEIMRSSSTRAKIVTEDEFGNIEETVDSFCLLIANNISTAAKGMKMAPKAKINDGLIDLLLFKSHRVPDLLRVFKKVYKGTHTQLPFVDYKQVRRFTVIPYKTSGKLETESSPEVAEELVDIDGELKGCTPFMCENVPIPLEIIL